MTAVADRPLAEQADLLASGEVTSAELVSHCLGRIQRLDRLYRAFVTVTAEAAMGAAVAADGAPRRHPLDGIPFALKDTIDTAGVRTTYGSLAYAEHVPAADDALVTRLRDAGLISLGKTATPELGLTCFTDSDLIGETRNPYNLSLTAGGSSGGAAVAVATGMVPVAQGGDTGGSIRIPAAACGLVGLKPSRGLVTGDSAVGLDALTVRGPIARTAGDAAMLLDAMAGAPWRLPVDAGRVTRRIGRFASAAGRPLDSECRRAFDRASATLADLGHSVDDITVAPDVGDYAEPLARAYELMAADSATALRDVDSLRPFTRAMVQAGRAARAEARSEVIQSLRRFADHFKASTAAYDIVLTPATALPPPRHGWFAEDDGVDVCVQRQLDYTPFTPIFNITGQPAIVVPVTTSADGLPLAVQMAAAHGADDLLLRLAAHLESATAWRRPPLAALPTDVRNVGALEPTP